MPIELPEHNPGNLLWTPIPIPQTLANNTISASHAPRPQLNLTTVHNHYFTNSQNDVDSNPLLSDAQEDVSTSKDKIDELNIVEDPQQQDESEEEDAELQMATDRIGLGFRRFGLLLRPSQRGHHSSGGRSASARSTSGTTIAQGLTVWGSEEAWTVKHLKFWNGWRRAGED
jgi:hypothetical protein